MAVTLVDLAKQTKSAIAKGFILDLLRYSDLIGIVPISGVDGLQVSGTRWQTLPGAAFRKIGGTYTESTGTTEEIMETLVVMGGDVKIDRVLTKVKNTKEDPLKTQMQQKAKAVSFAWNDGFINGDQAVNPDSFEGIKKRVSNAPARMRIDLGNLAILGSTANEHTFLDALHEGIKKVDGATHILCNESAYLGLGKVLRRLGLLETTTDAYGRTWEAFDKVPFVDVGLKSDKATEIIANTEDGGSNTSLYVVRLDTDDGLQMLQLNGTSPEPYDPLSGGESDAGPQYLRRIDWVIGLFNLSQYAIARIFNGRFAAT